MRLRPLVLAFCATTAATTAARAQMLLTSSTPTMSLESMSVGAGRSLSSKGIASGLKLGDEAILHAGVFADIGYDSNVFYSGGQQTSAVLHVSPRLEITNAERDGSIPGGTYYDLSAALDWRKYLSSDTTITQQDALNPSVGGTAEFSSGQILSLSLSDTFSRYQQAPYAPGSPITTDNNMASASLRFAPGGGRLRVMLRYNNLITKYEGGYDSGSYMGNEGVLDIGWRWLPRTTIYAQVAQGAITYFNSNAAVSSSYPLRTLLGLRGLLTEKLAVNIAAGYNNAFYSSGDTPTGFGNVGIVAEVNYTMSLLSRAGFGYHHDFVNSPFLGGYYNMDAIYGAFQQMVASRVVTYLFGRFENRRFGKVPNEDRSRVDNYVMGGVALDYMIGKFFQAGASYSLNLNRTATASTITTTDSNGNPVVTRSSLDYTKHVLLLRVGLMY
jgi:hypothetical protein